MRVPPTPYDTYFEMHSWSSRHSALPTSDPDDEVDSNKLALLSDRGDVSQRRSNSSGQLATRDDPPPRSRRE